MHFSFFQKFAGALLLAIWLVYGSIVAGNLLIDPKEVDMAAVGDEAEVKTAKADGKAETAAPEQDFKALLAAAKPETGEKIFSKCKACHTAEQGGASKLGPNLWGVIGRPKAGGEGFAYSDAMKKLGGEWTFADLNEFLANPKKFAPGTKMTFAGLKNEEDRAHVIAYLSQLSDSPKPRK